MASDPENSLHLWRSRTVDAFARAEASVEALLRSCNAIPKHDQIGPKVEQLRKAKPPASWPESRKTTVDAALAQLALLLPLRNDLVHAPMLTRKDGEHVVAGFANPALRCDFSRTVREFSAPRLQALAAKVTHIANQLDGA